MTLSNETIKQFRQYLINEEKSPATVRKYIHDAAAFLEWLDGEGDCGDGSVVTTTAVTTEPSPCHAVPFGESGSRRLSKGGNAGDTPTRFAPLRGEMPTEGDAPAQFAPLRGEMSPEATKGCKGPHPNINKEILLAYKDYLKQKYAPASVNAVISSLNRFFEYMGRYDLKLKSIKIQRRIFAPEERELKKEEYKRLLKTAREKGKSRLYLIIKCLIATGIRVSELRHITMESLIDERAVIDCKGKQRVVIISHDLCVLLKRYAKERGIKSGSIFITRSGNPIDRSNLAKELKKLAAMAKVAAKKVFPHNFRHLFARIYYNKYTDLGKLADILGHTNVNTTRIYTMETGEIHRRQIEALGLV